MNGIFTSIAELFAEAFHEIAAEPITFVVELVQFVVLLFIVKAIAIGFGEREGMVVGMLKDRRERLRLALDDAASASEELDAARVAAADMLSRARSEARRVVTEARRSADSEAAEVLAAVEVEAAEIEREVQETLAKERAEMLGGVHDQLVDLVTQATRQVLDEGYSPAEQRELIQKSVVESLGELESVSLQ